MTGKVKAKISRSWNLRKKVPCKLCGHLLWPHWVARHQKVCAKIVVKEKVGENPFNKPFNQFFFEALSEKNGWEILAVDDVKNTMIVQVPLKG